MKLFWGLAVLREAVHVAQEAFECGQTDRPVNACLFIALLHSHVDVFVQRRRNGGASARSGVRRKRRRPLPLLLPVPLRAATKARLRRPAERARRVTLGLLRWRWTAR